MYCQITFADFKNGALQVNSHELWTSFIEEKSENLIKQLEIQEGDRVLFTSGESWEALEKLGNIRIQHANALQNHSLLSIESSLFKFLWVVDFPLFEKQAGQTLASAHHPFTSPHPSDREKLSSFFGKGISENQGELLGIKASAYDIVCNGWEIGGGSIRNHNPVFQEEIFKLLNFEDQSQFAHLMQSLRLGSPPHGGIALGFDRIMAILCDTRSIRDVIAFPKSTSGNELMTGSPSTVSNSELAEFGISINK